jgi:FKBP-type peptidyl-prolyl cis-trans isomerase SlpA
MSNLPHLTVAPDSYLTLHYRIASKEGNDIISTFADRPATIQLGTGQLAPFLESRLIGLPDGAHQVFELQPEEAFGMHNPELVQQISRGMLTQESEAGEEYGIGDLVEFSAPSGGRFAGVVKALEPEYALFDFNHPLAGQTVKFEVQIIGIL